MADRTALRLSATLLLVGQLLYIVVTLFHTGGPANDHPTIFAAYAASGNWTAVHVAQFACMVVLLAGLFALFFGLDGEAETAKWAGRFGAASAVAALALVGLVLAVDGVALKQAVNAWVNAPDAEKAARFATAGPCGGWSGGRGATRTSRWALRCSYSRLRSCGQLGCRDR